jgi:hypothetical protein
LVVQGHGELACEALCNSIRHRIDLLGNVFSYLLE